MRHATPLLIRLSDVATHMSRFRDADLKQYLPAIENRDKLVRILVLFVIHPANESSAVGHADVGICRDGVAGLAGDVIMQAVGYYYNELIECIDWDSLCLSSCLESSAEHVAPPDWK